jgi:antirestriction protein ArdC
LGAAVGQCCRAARSPAQCATGRPYSGINILILWIALVERGFTGQTWLPFRQALTIGAHVRKGEKGTTVVDADRFIPYRERARRKPATNPKPFRSSSTSRSSTPTSARIFRPTSRRCRHRLLTS